MLDLKSHLLFSLAFSIPENESVQHPSDVFSSAAQRLLTYPELQWRLFDFSPNSIRSAVSTMQQQGLVVTVQQAGKIFIRMTAAGREHLFSSLPETVFKKKKWDAAWRLAIFSNVRYAPESLYAYRTLRNLLRTHGFVSLERAVYISPYPIGEKLKNELMRAKVMGLFVFLESKRFLIGDEREFCRSVWNLDERAKDYTKLSKLTTSLLSVVQKEKALNDGRKHQYSRLSSDLFSLLARDPDLPTQVLGAQFPHVACVQEYLRLSTVVFSLDRSH
ncbi:MAG: hypothetical protein HZA34_00830 [Candidatus Pacebacteria bacterium]|nr:hypothetical protein [Candidatus Paceibacterota bacterium]